MNALTFPNQYNRAVKDFFQRCCQVETMDAKKMQEISMSLDNGYFTLYLETDENHFSQEFELWAGDKVEAMHFIY